MATNESEFKAEIKSSFERLHDGTLKAWAPADKIRAGVADLHVLKKRFYAIELKWINKLPSRTNSNILTHPFTKKQILFLREVSACEGGLGIGIICLNREEAIIVEPDRLDSVGNMSRSAAEFVYSSAKNCLIKTRGRWNVEKILEYQKKPKVRGISAADITVDELHL